MVGFLGSLFDTSDFMPRWYCGSWTPAQGWLHIISDLAIWSAYMAIPLLLGYFVIRRRDLPFRWMFWLFCAFIFACGTTHLIEAIIFWKPIYRIGGVVKFATAVVSWSTVVALAPLTPRVLSLRSPAELEREIADRKRAEEKLRESEARFRNAFENAAIGMGLCGLDGQWFQVNSVLCDMLGYSESDLLGMTPRRLTHPDDWPRQQPLIDKLLAGEIRFFHIEKRYLHKQGRVVWVLASVSLMRSDDGRPQYYINQFQDISHRKHIEESLRLQTRIIDQAHDAVVSTTLDGHVTSWNKGAQTIYGYAAQEVVGRPLSFLEPPTKTESSLGEAIRAVLQKGTHEIEAQTIRKDGTEVLVHSSLTLLRDEEQQPLGIVHHSIDITERRRLEAKIQQAQKLESLGVLAGGIAHDFNNLLMGVLGHADLAILEMAPEAPGRHNIEHIRTAALRAGDLCKQLLAYSGKGRFVILSIDLAKLVEEMTHLLEVSVSRRAVLKYEFAPHVPAIEGDPTQIRQVVMNLITNASEAIVGAAGLIVVRVKAVDVDEQYLDRTYLHESLPTGHYVCLEVTDNGCGMDAETRKRIFDPFFSTKFTGRGLGLAAVLGIVRGHRGALQVYSEQHRGTTFRILLPCSTKAAQSTAFAPSSAIGWHAQGKVLVADDDDEVRQVTRSLLEKVGFEVLTAENGREAVDLFRLRPDVCLVILDLTMPVMDGAAALDQIRQVREDVPVLIFSGYSEQDAATRFAGKRLAGFIQKPFEANTLVATLREILEGARKE